MTTPTPVSDIVVLGTIQAAGADVTFENGVLNVNGLASDIRLSEVIEVKQFAYAAGTKNKKTLTMPASPTAGQKYGVRIFIPRLNKTYTATVVAVTGETQLSLNDKFMTLLDNAGVNVYLDVVEATSSTITIETRSAEYGPINIELSGPTGAPITQANTTAHVEPRGIPAQVTVLGQGFDVTVSDAGTYRSWHVRYKDMVANNGPAGPGALGEKSIWIVADEAAANYADFATALNDVFNGVAGALAAADNHLGVPIS